MARQAKKDKMFETARAALLRDLGQIQNPGVQIIYSGEKHFSITDLIRDIHARTPQGNMYVELHMEAQSTIAEYDNERKQKRNIILGVAASVSLIVVCWFMFT
jgi:hypothetical protein